MSINIEALKSALLSSARELLPRWLPAGRMIGAEFCVGDTSGSAGESLKVNVNKGVWRDFAADTGGDLIDLYAAVNGLSNGDALKQLAEFMGQADRPAPTPVAKPPARRTVIPVPPQLPQRPDMIHSRHGAPSASWAYKDGSGRLLGYVARYDHPDGSKDILPWTMGDYGNGDLRWSAAQWAEPRPLYGLERLAARPNVPVLLVEGEKAADAADKLAPFYVAVSWPGGASAWHKCGWQALKGRRVLAWPDADAAGAKCMAAIAEHLQRIGAAEVKIIDVSGQPDAWDAADAVAEGWTFDQFVAWAKPRSSLVAKAPPAPEQRPAPVGKPVDSGGDAPRETPRATVTHISAARTALAVAAEPSTDPVTNLRQLWDELGLACQGNGNPLCNASNVLIVLQGVAEFRDMVWYDEFLIRYLTTRTPSGVIDGKRHEWNEAQEVWLMVKLQRDYGLSKVNRANVQDAVIALAQRRRCNELRDWLERLTWDGVERIGQFLPDIFGTADNAYNRSAGKNFWLSMAVRAMRPGCKVDNMLVLEGAQGVGKSTALRIIGGDYFTEMHEEIGTKDFLLSMQGKLLIEISELSSFKGRALEKVKGVISNQVDRLRVPYGKGSADYPRQSVFAGTTNRDDWNEDETGARRFWPVLCHEINLQILRDNREQYFAEAVAKIRDGGTWWVMPADEAKHEQDARRVRDDWEQIFRDWLVGRPLVTTRELLTECLKFESKDIKQSDSNRAARCLKAIGWYGKLDRSTGKPGRVYRPLSRLDDQDASENGDL